MSAFLQKLRKLRNMDSLDVVNHVADVVARARTQTIYRLFFKAIGRRSWLKKPAQLWGASRISIGQDVRIERGSILYVVKQYAGKDYTGSILIGDETFANRDFNATSAFGIKIGRGVVFAPNVFLNDFDHGYLKLGEHRLRSDLISKGPIAIGDGCWIGANAFISSGVELGEQCVVGANSVVTKSFPAFSVIAGAPAKLVKRFDKEQAAWLVAPSVDDQG